MAYGDMEKAEELSALLPKRAWALISAQKLTSLEEIRIRLGRPVQLIYAQTERMLHENVDEELCKLLLECFCAHSIYAWEEELRNCFLTLPGGYRVGLSGRLHTQDGEPLRLTRISGFNIRIARECKGCAAPLVPRLTDDEGRPVSTLVISAPGVGKTTLLRDIARIFSYGLYGVKARKVAIADERSELAGAYNGRPTLDVGPRTDIMDGCKKREAMLRLIRTMSPELLITDELGGSEDASAVAEACACGVAVIASAHASNESELFKRSSLRAMLAEGCFTNIVTLTRSQGKLGLECSGGGEIISDLQ